MKFSKDVTADMLEDIIELYLTNLREHREDAKQAYEADAKDEFHKYMYDMFGLAEEMLLNRLSPLTEPADNEK